MLREKKRLSSWFVVCVVLSGAVASCSDDTTETPKADTNTKIDSAGGGTDKGVDASPAADTTPKEDSVIEEDAPADGGITFVDCSKESDGTNCSASGDPGFICLGGVCKASICGDQYVDAQLGEECDDGNQDPLDGCSACHWICKDTSNCDDEMTCNGAETCNTITHLCELGTPLVDGTACKLATGADGECNGGVCGPAGCGNGVKAGTEECDDGNQDNGDGCDNDCTFSCHANTDCDDGDACNGVESCKMETDKQYCEAGVTPTCDDSKACTTDTCDPATGCLYTPIDADNDGKSCEDDCDDGDAYVYVGAPECLDGKDNDCDNQVDESPTVSNVTCWQDYDKDGFSHVGASTKDKFCGSPCDTGYTALDPSVADQKDCAPCVSSAYPGQTDWFTQKHCTTSNCKLLCIADSYDYDCDGVEKQRWTATASTCKYYDLGGLFVTCKGSGWSSTVPACGSSGKYQSCSVDKVTPKTCNTSTTIRTQECH